MIDGVQWARAVEVVVTRIRPLPGRTWAAAAAIAAAATEATVTAAHRSCRPLWPRRSSAPNTTATAAVARTVHSARHSLLYTSRRPRGPMPMPTRGTSRSTVTFRLNQHHRVYSNNFSTRLLRPCHPWPQRRIAPAPSRARHSAAQWTWPTATWTKTTNRPRMKRHIWRVAWPRLPQRQRRVPVAHRELCPHSTLRAQGSIRAHCTPSRRPVVRPLRLLARLLNRLARPQLFLPYHRLSQALRCDLVSRMSIGAAAFRASAAETTWSIRPRARGPAQPLRLPLPMCRHSAARTHSRTIARTRIHAKAGTGAARARPIWRVTRPHVQRSSLPPLLSPLPPPPRSSTLSTPQTRLATLARTTPS